MTKRPFTMVCRDNEVLSGQYRDHVIVMILRSFCRRCTLPYFNPWTSVAGLRLLNIVITRPLVQPLLEFLNLPFANDPSGTGSNDEHFRWIDIVIQEGQFAVDSNTGSTRYPVREQDHCTHSDIHAFIAAIADRTLRLTLLRSHEILPYVLSTPRVHNFSVEELTIDQTESLFPIEYERLGTMIQRSVRLRALSIHLPLADGAHQLFDALDNAISLQKLSICEPNLRQRTSRQAAGLLVGNNGSLIRLLQNPQCQLKKLSLSKLGLDDQHITVLSQMLPTCQIAVFDVSGNFIESAGILEFARELPRMRTLEVIDFRSNPWEDSATACAALVEGIMKNTSIDTLHSYCTKAQEPLLPFHLILNGAGRRILSSLQPIPKGLWALLLERAGDNDTYRRRTCWKFKLTDYEWDPEIEALYVFLRNCPAILAFFR